MNEKKYYAVTVKQGHCGFRRNRTITFSFCASNIIEAIDRAKEMPSVKHHNNAVILGCREITWSEYTRMRASSAYEERIG